MTFMVSEADVIIVLKYQEYPSCIRMNICSISSISSKMVKFDEENHDSEHSASLFNCFFCQKDCCQICEPGWKTYCVKGPEDSDIIRCVSCCRRKLRAYTCVHAEDNCKSCEHPFDLELYRLVITLSLDGQIIARFL